MQRKPFFYLINVAMPASLFSLLAIVLMLLPANYPPSRLTYQLTLTLTVVAYKVSLMNMLPAITYLTVLDKLQLLCFFIILAVVFETTVVGSLIKCGAETADCQEHDFILNVDRVSQAVAGAAWLLVHFWFARVAWVEHYSSKLRTAPPTSDLAESSLTTSRTSGPAAPAGRQPLLAPSQQIQEPVAPAPPRRPPNAPHRRLSARDRARTWNVFDPALLPSEGRRTSTESLQRVESVGSEETG